MQARVGPSPLKSRLGALIGLNPPPNGFREAGGPDHTASVDTARDETKTLASTTLDDPGADGTRNGDTIVVTDPMYAAEQPDYRPERIEPDADGRYTVGAFGWT